MITTITKTIDMQHKVRLSSPKDLVKIGASLAQVGAKSDEENLGNALSSKGLQR